MTWLRAAALHLGLRVGEVLAQARRVPGEARVRHGGMDRRRAFDAARDGRRWGPRPVDPLRAASGGGRVYSDRVPICHRRFSHGRSEKGCGRVSECPTMGPGRTSGPLAGRPSVLRSSAMQMESCPDSPGPPVRSARGLGRVYSDRVPKRPKQGRRSNFENQRQRRSACWPPTGHVPDLGRCAPHTGDAGGDPHDHKPNPGAGGPPSAHAQDRCLLVTSG